MDFTGITNGVYNAKFSIENYNIVGRQLKMSPAVISIVKYV